LFGHECFVLLNGGWKKDMKYLNRDMKKIIVIETENNSKTL